MTRTETGGRARPRREFPIAVHLTLFAVLTLIPVMLLVTWMLIDTARLRRDDSLHDAWITVDHLNATIEVEIQKAFAVAETLATSHALIDGDYDGFNSQARDAANRLSSVDGVGIVELNELDVVRHPLVTQIIRAYSRPANK